MHKVTDKTDYLEFIQRLKDTYCWDVRLGDSKHWIDEGLSVISIRHDVDKDLDKALEMARFEYKNGIRSTYFLLHTASYFDYTQLFLEKCQEIQNMSHEIGIHNNSIIEWMKLCEGNWDRPLRTGLLAPVDFLRQGGIEIKGTSAHGSDDNYKYGALNYEVWKEYDPKMNLGLGYKGEQFSLEEFDLEYEAYFLPYTHYLSDSGGNWLGLKVDGPKMFERDILNSERNIGLDIIDDFNKDGGFLQILIHPCWWEGE